MTTKTEKDYCQCGKDVPRTWFGTCEVCKKEYLFPHGRPLVTHPKPFEECKKILRDEVERQVKLWGHVSRDRRDLWDNIWHLLLDGEFCSIHKGYFLMGCGIFCGPHLYGMITLYFTSAGGAVLWRKLNYRNAQYDLDVCEKK